MTKHALCDISAVAEGTCQSFIVEGTRVALFNINGEFHATQNHCTHKGAQLVKGALEGSIIECSQHGWKFDVTSGKCLSPGHGRSLKLFQVAVEQGSVLIELEDKSKPEAVVVAVASTPTPEPTIEFHAVATVDDLEDEEVIEISVGDEAIALYRLGDDFFATHGLCTHEKVKLCDGIVEGDLIECPLHSACFEIKTGKAVNPPAEIDLKIYPVKLKDNRIYIGVESD